MKARTDGREFAEVITWASRTVGTSHMSALTGVVLDAADGKLTIEATDLETSVRASVPAAVDEPGRVLVPRTRLAQVVARFGDAPAEMVADDRFTVRCGRVEATLRTLAVEDFPDLPQVDGDGRPFPWGRVTEAVAPCVGKETDRAALTGIRVGDGTVAATDGYRLAILATDVEGDATVPPALFSAAPDDARLVVGDVFAAAVSQDRTVTSRLVEARFPDVEKLWPGTDGVTLVVDRQALIDALTVVMAVTGREKAKGAETNFPICRVTASGSELTVEGRADGDQIADTIDVVASEDLAFSVNPAFLASLAKAHTGEQVTLSQREGPKPIAVTSDDDTLRTLVMPIIKEK